MRGCPVHCGHTRLFPASPTTDAGRVESPESTRGACSVSGECGADAATQREKDAAMQAKANAQAAELLAKEKRKAKDVVEQANAAMREAKRLQAEANAKYAEAEAVLSRFGLADVPPQPTPPQKGAEATPAASSL